MSIGVSPEALGPSTFGASSFMPRSVYTSCVRPPPASVSLRLHGSEDVAGAIELFKMQYYRYVVLNRS